ncbi:UNVERIFIED_CONTAM: hypothetical protein GTU68_009959, partial [Idotea baltica]|nr:hypothetical protein [Idotea baltica]
GGSEAVEAALKLARQYHLENGEPQRRHIIARHQSYHGNTLGALAAGGNQWRRSQFEPILINVSHIAPCYEYVHRAADESAYAYGQRAARELEDEILRLGPDTVMAFIAEPVVGATLGAVPAVAGYYKRIREICDQYGVLLILDEVMCGMGRTGHLFACSADEIAPDILCIAKGLGAGYQPIGAMLCTREIYQTFATGSGFFQHGHTYLGHPVATAAGFAVVTALLERNLVPRVAELGAKLADALHQRFGNNPNIGESRARLFQGLNSFPAGTSKTALRTPDHLAAKLKAATFDAGLICYPMSGTRDGRNGDHILLAPPFIMADTQIDEIVDKLDQAIQSVL